MKYLMPAACIAIAGCGGGSMTAEPSADATVAASPAEPIGPGTMTIRGDEVRVDQLAAYAPPATAARTPAPTHGTVMDVGSNFIVVQRGVRVFISPQTIVAFDRPLSVLQKGHHVTFAGRSDPSAMNVHATHVRVSASPPTDR